MSSSLRAVAKRRSRPPGGWRVVAGARRSSQSWKRPSRIRASPLWHLHRHRRRRPPGRCARCSRHHEPHRIQGPHSLVVNDALIALQAGVGAAEGIVIVAGTGSIAYGCDRHGHAVRSGGWGYVLGDEGSGYWMGRLALRAIVREVDGRGQPTSLTPRVLAHFGVARPEELLHTVYRHDFTPAAVAALATHVQHAHDEGDAVATAILDRGAREARGRCRLRRESARVDRRRVRVRARGRHVPGGTVAARRGDAPAAEDHATKPHHPPGCRAGGRRRSVGARRPAWRREASDLQMNV